MLQDRSQNQAGPVIFFSADCSTRGEALFARVLQYAAKASSFSGYDGYLTGSFAAKAQPGAELTQTLLDGWPVDDLAYIEAFDTVTNANFQSRPLLPGSKLNDACPNLCDAVSPDVGPAECNIHSKCPDGSHENFCNNLTGSCDTGCCKKADGDSCSIRGFDSTCKNGVCEGTRSMP